MNCQISLILKIGNTIQVINAMKKQLELVVFYTEYRVAKKVPDEILVCGIGDL